MGTEKQRTMSIKTSRSATSLPCDLALHITNGMNTLVSPRSIPLRLWRWLDCRQSQTFVGSFSMFSVERRTTLLVSETENAIPPLRHFYGRVFIRYKWGCLKKPNSLQTKRRRKMGNFAE
ncbi:hypothetical protein AVEN_21747-1 [Araneus ventricosus]|uniref:Uncharacterized protein n=1 Tax=Araneus ventricosus TaxID=182803 RepID=A0A4Y2EUH4_ARAVE|nr:hypothetical protein AVEN_21747-1 [Araneus ventricosus]